MSKRIPSRRSNGRFQRATLENTFGLTTRVCPHCNGLNPHAVNESPPEVCGQCGKSLLAQKNAPVVWEGRYDRRCDFCWSVTECRTVEIAGRDIPAWGCDECIEELTT